MSGAGSAHIEALGAGLGRPLALGAEGTLELQFDDGVAVTFELASERTLYVYGVLGETPTDASSLRALLEAHFFGRLAGRACLATDPSSAELLLMQAIELDRHAPHEMNELLDDFLALARRWRDLLPRLMSEATKNEETFGADQAQGETTADIARTAFGFPGLRV